MHGKESNRPRLKEPEKNAVETIIYRLLTAAQNECKSCRVRDRKRILVKLQADMETSMNCETKIT